jgi:hypothetical protein
MAAVVAAEREGVGEYRGAPAVVNMVCSTIV